MNRFNSFFLVGGLALLVGCANPQAPGSTARAQDVQEGIGGDLAALYVKSVGCHSVDGVGTVRVNDFQMDLEKVRIHSEESLSELLVREGDILLVDRSRVAYATQNEIAMSLLSLLGYSDLKTIAQAGDQSLANLSTESTVDFETAKNRTQSILELSRTRIFTSRPGPMEVRGSDFGVSTPDDAIKFLSKAFLSIRWKLTDSILIDRTTRKPVDAIRGTVDENGIRTVLISAKRIKSAGPLVSVLPALMIHETAHHHLVGQTGDDVTYAFTMQLFSPAMLFF